MYTTTVITALYDIGRGDLKGQSAYRPFSKYLEWFKYVLRINAPMVIFIPASLKYYIDEHRPKGYDTTVIIREFEELNAYKYRDQITDAINDRNNNPKFSGLCRDCPEFITYKYQTVIYSKFDFLKEVSEANPYNTEYFIWMDAGTFYHEPTFNYKLVWPDPYKIKILKDDKFLIYSYDYDVKDKIPLDDSYTYMNSSSSHIIAFILGGTSRIINKVHKDFWNLVEDKLEQKATNNEQIILQLLALTNEDDYYIYPFTRERYPHLKDDGVTASRMVPHELSTGTLMGVKYPINKDIKLLTVASKELPTEKYHKWITTAEYFGYDYEIIGRNTKWEGFGTKIKLYADALKNITSPYVVMTDCSDLFFVAPSYQMYDNYLRTNKDLIVGGELYMAYPGGHHDHNVIESYFNSISKSSQKFPNSGFLIGRTYSMNRLMDLHISYTDDQGPCFDTIYENRHQLDVDYNTDLIGNIPDYHNTEKTKQADDYFIFDPLNNQYKNVISGSYPSALHFPGGYWSSMNNMYNKVFNIDGVTLDNIMYPNSISCPYDNAIWIFVLCIVLIILFIFLARYIYNKF